MEKYVLLLCILLYGCGEFENSPFSDELHTNLRNSNQKQYEELRLQAPPTDALHFALLTDSHLDYEDLWRVIKYINESGAHLSVHLGDMTMISSAVEYDAFTELIKKLNMPYFVAMGNHDAIVKGPKIYNKIFGPYNISFIYGGIKFIVFNDIGIEFDLDFDWLNTEVASTSLPVFIFSHAGLMAGDVQSGTDMHNYARVIERPQVKALFYGHGHIFKTDFTTAADGQQKLIQQIATVRGQNYGKVTVRNTNLKVELCTKQSCNEEIDFNFTY